jgi:hypothetical protein
MQWAEPSPGAAVHALRQMHLFRSHYASLAGGAIRSQAVSMLSPQQTGDEMTARLMLLHQCLCITRRLKVTNVENTTTTTATATAEGNGNGGGGSCVEMRAQLAGSSVQSFSQFCRREVLGQRSANFPDPPSTTAATASAWGEEALWSLWGETTSRRYYHLGMEAPFSST